MSLVEVTESLWVASDRVVSVERRTVTARDGSDHEYTEVTLDTHVHWDLDIPLDDVIRRLTEW